MVAKVTAAATIRVSARVNPATTIGVTTASVIGTTTAIVNSSVYSGITTTGAIVYTGSVAIATLWRY
ncbi:hypothetical protein DEO27_023800 [Mucilaginibacter rubeus]|uniref:Uncharacterized protein n=1 Tax=Mucilaginibacter rubeus TaxID=2027860 RepID=A0A5C1I4S1_9SPHI|nr:hypothetical protein DEO27_023800 [Mucilaginibacter rubeus]